MYHQVLQGRTLAQQLKEQAVLEKIGHLEPVADGVQVQVVDTGVGISESQLPALGEPFNRLDHRHSGIEGTGIGLAVTRGLIQLMAGRLDVESTLGEGSTFSVFLPDVPTAGTSGQSASLPT